MNSRIVEPDTDVLTLANGDTLLVRRRLNHGEQRRAYARMYVAGVDGSLHSNPFTTGDNMIIAYLIDWSLQRKDGTPIHIRGQEPDDVQAALDLLDPADVREIKTAIEQHENRYLAKRAEEKKLQGGNSGDAAILPSPSAAAGASSGSENSTPTTT